MTREDLIEKQAKDNAHRLYGSYSNVEATAYINGYKEGSEKMLAQCDVEYASVVDSKEELARMMYRQREDFDKALEELKDKHRKEIADLIDYACHYFVKDVDKDCQAVCRHMALEQMADMQGYLGEYAFGQHEENSSKVNQTKVEDIDLTEIL